MKKELAPKDSPSDLWPITPRPTWTAKPKRGKLPWVYVDRQTGYSQLTRDIAEAARGLGLGLYVRGRRWILARYGVGGQIIQASPALAPLKETLGLLSEQKGPDVTCAMCGDVVRSLSQHDLVRCGCEATWVTGGKESPRWNDSGHADIKHGHDCVCRSCKETFCQFDGCRREGENVILGRAWCDEHARSRFTSSKKLPPLPSKEARHNKPPV